MGIFDKNEGSIFGDKPDTRAGGSKGSPADFSDTSSGSATPAPGRKPADFADVTSGQSTETPASGSSGGSIYTVQSGDSLSKIAKAQYGDASQWKRIYEANKEKIKNPDLIYPGQEFTIPPA